MGECILHLRFSLKKLHGVYLYKHLVECHFGYGRWIQGVRRCCPLWHLATPLPALALCPGRAQNVVMRGGIPGRCMLRRLTPGLRGPGSPEPTPRPGAGWFASWGFGFTPDSLPQPLGHQPGWFLPLVTVFCISLPSDRGFAVFPWFL